MLFIKNDCKQLRPRVVKEKIMKSNSFVVARPQKRYRWVLTAATFWRVIDDARNDFAEFCQQNCFELFITHLQGY